MTGDGCAVPEPGGNVDLVARAVAPSLSRGLGQQVMMMFDQVSTSLGHIRAGKPRPLAVTSRKRSPLLPELPTIDESGVKGYEDVTFNGLVAPAGTPRARGEHQDQLTQGEEPKPWLDRIVSIARGRLL